MHLLILTSTFPINEDDHVSAPFIIDFIEELIELGHQISVITQDKPGVKKALIPGVEPVWYKWRNINKPLVNINPFSREVTNVTSLIINGWQTVNDYVVSNNVDFCLALWTIPAGFLARRAKKRYQIPYAVWALGADIYNWPKYPIAKTMIKRVLRDADLVFADGYELCDLAKKLSGKQCEFMSTSRRLHLNASDIKVNKNKTNFLFIGRWEPVKGVDVLLEAANWSLKENNEAHFYIIGEGSLGEDLHQTIKNYALHDNVFLIPPVSNKVAAAYLKSCDYLIIPSRMESIPVIFSDAMQAKIPVIVTDVGDMGYLVKKFNVGKVIKPDDVGEMQKAIIDAINNPFSFPDSSAAALFNLFSPKLSATKFIEMTKKGRNWSDE